MTLRASSRVHCILGTTLPTIVVLAFTTLVIAEPPPAQEYQRRYEDYRDARRSEYQSDGLYNENPRNLLDGLLRPDDVQTDSIGWQKAVPGIPGEDYPNLDHIPETSFTCSDKTPGGYYADVETKCQVFHVCNTGGVKSSFLCPSGSIFNQKYFVCDWWYDFECENAPELYTLNDQLKRGSAIASSLQQDYRDNNDERGSGRDNQYFTNRFQVRGNSLNDVSDLSLAGTGEGRAEYTESQRSSLEDQRRQAQRYNSYEQPHTSESKLENRDKHYQPWSDNQRASNREPSNEQNQYRTQTLDDNLGKSNNSENADNYKSGRNEHDRKLDLTEFLPPLVESSTDTIPRGFALNYGRDFDRESHNRNNERRVAEDPKTRYPNPQSSNDKFDAGPYRYDNKGDDEYADRANAFAENGNFGQRFPIKIGITYVNPTSETNEHVKQSNFGIDGNFEDRRIFNRTDDSSYNFKDVVKPHEFRTGASSSLDPENYYGYNSGYEDSQYREGQSSDVQKPITDNLQPPLDTYFEYDPIARLLAYERVPPLESTFRPSYSTGQDPYSSSNHQLPGSSAIAGSTSSPPKPIISVTITSKSPARVTQAKIGAKASDENENRSDSRRYLPDDSLPNVERKNRFNDIDREDKSISTHTTPRVDTLASEEAFGRDRERYLR